MCGEQPDAALCLLNAVGSPPRVRGTVWEAYPRKQAKGITPACAGNSRHTKNGRARAEDHPRVCGEQPSIPPLHGAQRGSPPRVRGTDYWEAAHHPADRITPACAGNRCPRRRPWRWGWDHPRVCGEQYCNGLPMDNNAGSPPRVRGTGFYIFLLPLPAGITPACAGNSFACLRGYTDQKDHPRVCGEQYLCRNPAKAFVGSPPRVRGTVDRLGEFGELFRITPACAGNSTFVRGWICSE